MWQSGELLRKRLEAFGFNKRQDISWALIRFSRRTLLCGSNDTNLTNFLPKNAFQRMHPPPPRPLRFGVIFQTSYKRSVYYGPPAGDDWRNPFSLSQVLLYPQFSFSTELCHCTGTVFFFALSPHMLGTVFSPPKNPGVWWMIYNEANDRVETPFVTAAFASFLIQYNFFLCYFRARKRWHGKPRYGI
jgi:hypothetical protein